MLHEPNAYSTTLNSTHTHTWLSIFPSGGGSVICAVDWYTPPPVQQRGAIRDPQCCINKTSRETPSWISHNLWMIMAPGAVTVFPSLWDRSRAHVSQCLLPVLEKPLLLLDAPSWGRSSFRHAMRSQIELSVTLQRQEATISLQKSVSIWYKGLRNIYISLTHREALL